jgi:hypothetical protein
MSASTSPRGRYVVVQEGHRPPAQTPSWNRRSWTAAVIAACGLASVTWLEVRSVNSHSAKAESLRVETSSAGIVSRYPGETTPLIPAERVRPHTLTDAIGQQRAATSAGLQSAASSRVTRVTPNAPARIARRGRVPLPPVAIVGSLGGRGGRTTDLSRMGLPTAAIDSALVPKTLHANTASAEPPRRDAAKMSRGASSNARDDEPNIYNVVQEYERAYEQLDVNAVRAIWPSVDARALARAFDGLKEQKLELGRCRVVVATGEATVVCGGRASCVTRVGDHAARTEPREWTFHLRKIDANWLIAKAEVQ